MRKISSSVYMSKRVFPIVWFGFLSVFLAVGFYQFLKGGAPISVLIVPTVMMAFGYTIMRIFIFDLVDEAYLYDDWVIVRNAGDEDRFPVTNILNVDSSFMTNPERITLTLRQPCKFGGNVTFSPPKRWWRFSRHPLALELIRRAHGLEEA